MDFQNAYEAANYKVQQLQKESNCFKILNAMLNGYTDQHYNRFNETKLVIIKDILFSDDLEQLSELYDDSFLVPMRAKGGRPSSRPQSATERVQGQERDSHSSSIKSNVFKTAVRDRDDNRCVLTGETDIFSFQQDTKNGHQVLDISN